MPLGGDVIITDTIHLLIDRFLEAPAEGPIDLRDLVSRERILPVWYDTGGCYALRPSGEVVSFVWDEESVQNELDPRVRNIAYSSGAKRYPELAAFVPQRTSTARICETCDGTGQPSQLPQHLRESIVCYCGGLGWLPAGTPPN